jgi:hypothetical protein
MKEFTLSRDDQNESRSFGMLLRENGTRVAETIELPWLDNEAQKSCVPPERFVFALRYSAKHGYAVPGALAVPGRSNIEVHIDNVVQTLLGCIGLGTVRGTLEYPKESGVMVDAVLNSKTAFIAFMKEIGCENYAQLTSDEAVRGFCLAHPDSGQFAITFSNMPVVAA